MDGFRAEGALPMAREFSAPNRGAHREQGRVKAVAFKGQFRPNSQTQASTRHGAVFHGISPFDDGAVNVRHGPVTGIDPQDGRDPDGLVGPDHHFVFQHRRPRGHAGDVSEVIAPSLWNHGPRLRHHREVGIECSKQILHQVFNAIEGTQDAHHGGGHGGNDGHGNARNDVHQGARPSLDDVPRSQSDGEPHEWRARWTSSTKSRLSSR